MEQKAEELSLERGAFSEKILKKWAESENAAIFAYTATCSLCWRRPPSTDMETRKSRFPRYF